MAVEIIDVHSSSREGIPTFDLSKQILDGLSKPLGEKEMPTMLLYDERGLRLYDDITTAAPEYYLFGAEEEILKKHSDDIIKTMHSKGASPDEVVLELGAGALRKTSHILTGLSRFVEEKQLEGPITYYALDLEKRELERTLGEIEASDIGMQLNGKVATKGMCGTYDDGLKFIESGGLSHRDSLQERFSQFSSFAARGGSPIFSDSASDSSSQSGSDPTSDAATTPVSSSPTSPLAAGQPERMHIMFLGSSLGNFAREEAAAFLQQLPLRAGSGDTLLLGLDHDNAKEQIEEAYNDPQGYTRKFIMNGLRNAGRTMGDESLFEEDNWEYVNSYNPKLRKHEAYLKARRNHTVTMPSLGEVRFVENEMMKIEESVKYSESDTFSLFTDANLRPVQRWTDSKSQYSLWLLERPAFVFPLLRTPSADKVAQNLVSSTPFGFPARADWEVLWRTWTTVTRGMISTEMLYEKPIDLRHICLFYLGHIPTFLDIHLSRLLGQPHTEPEVYKYIFERGIDPDVEDPSQCHPHSEVPQNKEDWPSVQSILQFQGRVRQRLLKLYDDLESGAVKMTRRHARVLFLAFEHEAMHAETLLYMLVQRAGNGTLPPPGFIAPHWESLSQAWAAAPSLKSTAVTLGGEIVSLGHDDDESTDNEADVGKIKNHEFGWDNEHPKRTCEVNPFRIEWRPITNGQYYEFYQGEGRGKVSLPASWVEDNGTVMVRTLYGPVPMQVAEDWPVMASYNHLSTYAMVKGGRLPTEAELRLFYDKFDAGYEGGSNVGFRNWHPVPATTGLDKVQGKGHNGGIWEWTSTTFDATDGFQPSTLYPGYSADFFDDKHQVVLGGSYATIPRIANRRTFRNWYQKIYPYAWVGGRIAYDI